MIKWLKNFVGNSLAVRGLDSVEGAGSIPGWGIKIPHTTRYSKKEKIKNFVKLFNLNHLSSCISASCKEQIINHHAPLRLLLIQDNVITALAPGVLIPVVPPAGTICADHLKIASNL